MKPKQENSMYTNYSIITAEIAEIKSEREEMQFISWLAYFFLFMQLKNESKCFNLIKNEAS